MKKPKANSKLGEHSLIREFSRHGYIVSIPQTHECAYDFVVDMNNTLQRVQVKATSSTDDLIWVRLFRTHNLSNRTVRKNYKKEEIDWLGVYDERTDKCYLIPSVLIDNKSAFRMRLTVARNNQQKGIFMAKDFEIEKILKSLRV